MLYKEWFKIVKLCFSALMAYSNVTLGLRLFEMSIPRFKGHMICIQFISY